MPSCERVRAPLHAQEIEWELVPVDFDPADEEPLAAAILEALSFRTLAQQSLHFLREQQLQLLRLHNDLDRLRQENRALREPGSVRGQC